MDQVSNGHSGSSTNKNGFLSQAWLVLLLSLIFGIVLAAVQVNLSEVIAANKLNETLEKIPGLVLGPKVTDTTGLHIEPGLLTVETKGKRSLLPVYQVSKGNSPAGWVLKASGQGYADNIELLIGLNPAADTISGLFILEQKETPGLGNKVSNPEWRDQFIGKKTDTPLRVTTTKNKAPESIDAVTGATISSKSVTNIVNQTIGMAKGRLTPENIKSLKGSL